jgi:hypothetical protein
MNSRDERARQIQSQIREILLRDWDPVRVEEAPPAQDEYDAYVGGVYRLLASGASARSVAEHLAQVEGEQMGRGAPVEKLMSVATKLCALDVKMGLANGAV